VLVTGVCLEGMPASPLFELPRDEDACEHPHQTDQHDAAYEFSGGELPAEQDPQDKAKLPYEVRRCELECERRDCRRALLEQRFGDRDRRV
jgi:hypothetical protein